MRQYYRSMLVDIQKTLLSFFLQKSDILVVIFTFIAFTFIFRLHWRNVSAISKIIS